MKSVRLRFGVLPKMVLFLAVVLIPLAAITWYVSVRTLREEMTQEFTSKGTAIANSLASSGVDLILTRDASTVQALIDQFVSISGVHYVMVYDPQKSLIGWANRLAAELDVEGVGTPRSYRDLMQGIVAVNRRAAANRRLPTRPRRDQAATSETAQPPGVDSARPPSARG